ncbi:hypothetical protein BDV12DRAFT_199809 [Aspergillus spectabilis]
MRLITLTTLAAVMVTTASAACTPGGLFCGIGREWTLAWQESLPLAKRVFFLHVVSGFEQAVVILQPEAFNFGLALTGSEMMFTIQGPVVNTTNLQRKFPVEAFVYPDYSSPADLSSQTPMSMNSLSFNALPSNVTPQWNTDAVTQP